MRVSVSLNPFGWLLLGTLFVLPLLGVLSLYLVRGFRQRSGLLLALILSMFPQVLAWLCLLFGVALPDTELMLLFTGFASVFCFILLILFPRPRS